MPTSIRYISTQKNHQPRKKNLLLESEVEPNSIFEEVLARARTQFHLEDFCFDKQLAFVKDPKPFKTAVCSRRAGKTVGCAAHLIWAARSRPGVVCIYITLSRTNAKRLIWPELKRINERFNLGAVVNETELVMTFTNGSVIYVAGAHHASEIEKFRGLPIFLAYIDEAQAFRAYIKSLVDDVIGAALIDYAGTLCLTGTPGPVPAGYFYECANNPEWSHHAWTMFENPWLPKKSGVPTQVLLEREMARKGVTIDDPGIQRECFGRWVVDTDALVFKYNPAINHYEVLPQASTQWQCVIGVDLGYDDADAIAVIVWNDRFPGCYLREEHLATKQGITELATTLEGFVARYQPNRIVMDTGGLGKKIAEEIRKRFSIPVVAAEKSRKFEYIELLNDALRTGKFFAKKDSAFAQDTQLVEWDRDPEKKEEKLEIRDTYHSDICDATLYAFRECLHWLHEPETAIIARNSPAFFQREVNLMEEAAEEIVRQKGLNEPEPLEANPWGWG